MDIRLTLRNIYDTSDDEGLLHQDFPYRVSACCQPDLKSEAIAAIENSPTLKAFNVEANLDAQAGLIIDFCTFESESTIYRFFGLISPAEIQSAERHKIIRHHYVTTAGELRAAIAHLPDDFPIIHTSDGDGESVNRRGALVMVNEWAWQELGQDRCANEGICLRIASLGIYDWERLERASRG